jgi:protein-S-isoprenylcysteine O-methyltransferase Ste14
MKTKLDRILAATTTFSERYLLSLVFFFLALREIGPIWFLLTGKRAVETTLWIDTGHHLCLLVLNLITGLVLLLGWRPVVPPKNFKSVFIPLVATFYTLAYYSVPWFPKSWRLNLSPLALQKPLVVAGIVCIVIGPLISLWGILYLRRSFGVFVTLRKIVLNGPYRWVRHPMYLGWVCVCTGLVLANFSGAYFVLVSVHISILLYRAHLEEEHLAENSQDYQEYRKRTGFIFPKLSCAIQGLPGTKPH